MRTFLSAAPINKLLPSGEEHKESDYIIHRTGNGLGITGHESPYLAEGYDRFLESNMLIRVEPGIYILDFGSLRHSYSMIITSD
ncbi:MAG: M24 family metallopeptidase [Promethearchaeota archaeon]